MRALKSLVTGLALVLCAAPVGAQDRGARKEIVVGLAAEPRTMLAVTIVDWTTNTQLEHMYDRLLDRDPKTLKPRPMLATSWKVINDTTWEFALRKGVKFTTASRSRRSRSRPRSTTCWIPRPRATTRRPPTGSRTRTCR